MMESFLDGPCFVFKFGVGNKKSQPWLRLGDTAYFCAVLDSNVVSQQIYKPNKMNGGILAIQRESVTAPNKR